MNLVEMEKQAAANDRASFPNLSNPTERARFKEDQARELRNHKHIYDEYGVCFECDARKGGDE